MSCFLAAMFFTVFTTACQVSDDDDARVDAKSDTEDYQVGPVGIHLFLWYQGPYGALKVLKNLKFDWTKFKALKSLNFTK